MRVSIGMDHAGTPLREIILKTLESLGAQIIDHGTKTADSVDYPDFGSAVGKDVAEARADFGVAICSTGIGISIAANKIPGVRAALVHNEDGAHLSRKHNNANVLCMGARYVDEALAERCLRIFFDESFEAGRHLRRIQKIQSLEQENGSSC